jgi:hypothetical protein
MDGPAEYLTSPIKDGIVGFDGDVLEIFVATTEGSYRYHVELLKGIGVDRGRIRGLNLKLMLGTGLEQQFGITEEQQPEIERIVQAVWDRRGVT